jgi:hypothetical protein
MITYGIFTAEPIHVAFVSQHLGPADNEQGNLPKNGNDVHVNKLNWYRFLTIALEEDSNLFFVAQELS